MFTELTYYTLDVRDYIVNEQTTNNAHNYAHKLVSRAITPQLLDCSNCTQLLDCSNNNNNNNNNNTNNTNTSTIY